jgi:hypothetical protein
VAPGAVRGIALLFWSSWQATQVESGAHEGCLAALSCWRASRWPSCRCSHRVPGLHGDRPRGPALPVLDPHDHRGSGAGLHDAPDPAGLTRWKLRCTPTSSRREPRLAACVPRWRHLRARVEATGRSGGVSGGAGVLLRTAGGGVPHVRHDPRGGRHQPLAGALPRGRAARLGPVRAHGGVVPADVPAPPPEVRPHSSPRACSRVDPRGPRRVWVGLVRDEGGLQADRWRRHCWTPSAPPCLVLPAGTTAAPRRSWSIATHRVACGVAGGSAGCSTRGPEGTAPDARVAARSSWRSTPGARSGDPRRLVRQRVRHDRTLVAVYDTTLLTAAADPQRSR